MERAIVNNVWAGKDGNTTLRYSPRTSQCAGRKRLVGNTTHFVLNDHMDILNQIFKLDEDSIPDYVLLTLLYSGWRGNRSTVATLFISNIKIN